MSGFDFGSLRDPDAPQPDARHRAGVEARALELRRSASRKRMLVSGLALVVVIAAVAGIVAMRPNSGGSLSVTGRGSTTTAPAPSSSIGDRFVPPTTIENGLVVLPVTFPDGETTTLRYPPAMRIAQLGFAGAIGVGDTQAQIGYTTIAHLYGGSKPHATYPGANGATVPVFQGYKPVGIVGPPFPDELAFQFGPWLARISLEGKTGAQRANLARSLTGTVDTNGYLILHAHAPLSIGHGFDGGFGPFVGRNNALKLASDLYCGQPESDTSTRRRFVNGDGTRGVAWCTGPLHVSATGSPKFVDLAANELTVSSLATPLTSTPTTTTTTTTPPSPPAHAVSASFVSASRGWVAEQNGQLLGTTDGGRNWRAVGSLGRSDMTIRFADAMHGFAFSPYSGTPLLVTDDGGVHWLRQETPFSGVADLEISRGVVYVVAVPTKNLGKFGIWSARANHLVWSRDPLNLQIGAGPVPSEQIVFAGSDGWVLNTDRTVLPGARLSSTGHWVSWNPPCLDVNGPAYLTASTATDLVAACDEGVWGGRPKITAAVYFSHDGGANFKRQDAPGFGPVASPNASTAVIGENGALERTTDDGASWHVVAKFNDANAHPSDLGFTTPTQGFVIGSGEMLMTYDAGATWSQVTQP